MNSLLDRSGSGSPQGWKRRGSTLGALAALAFFGAIAYDVVANGPRAQQVATQLEHNLETVPVPTGTSKTGHHEGVKPRNVVVGNTFKTPLQRSAVVEHYAHALQQLGWAACGEVPRSNGGSDSRFCKNKLVAHVEWAPNSDWDYALDLTWEGD